MNVYEKLRELHKRVPPGLEGTEAGRRISLALGVWELGGSDEQVQYTLDTGTLPPDEIEGEVRPRHDIFSDLPDHDPEALEREGKPARRLAEQITSGDPKISLRAIRELRRLLDRAEFYAVLDARRHGWSWGDIAGVLQVKRQSVHERYAHRIHEPEYRRRPKLRVPVRRVRLGGRLDGSGSGPR